MGTSAKLAGYRPRAVRVRDARLADTLRSALEALAIPVDVVDELPAVDAFVAALTEATSENPVPAALDAPGVTPARLTAFADAAKRFFDAAPWRHLDDGDLIKVENPKAGRGLSLASFVRRRCNNGASLPSSMISGDARSVREFRLRMSCLPGEPTFLNVGNADVAASEM